MYFILIPIGSMIRTYRQEFSRKADPLPATTPAVKGRITGGELVKILNFQFRF